MADTIVSKYHSISKLELITKEPEGSGHGQIPYLPATPILLHADCATCRLRVLGTQPRLPSSRTGLIT